MMVTIRTTISFKLPEENDKLMEFLQRNDCKDWRAVACGQFFSFSKEETFHMKFKEEDNA